MSKLFKTRLPDDLLDNIDHKSELTLCAVMGNERGEVVYAVHLKDKKNLEKSIGFEIIVHPDGQVTFYQEKNPDDLLELLEPVPEVTEEDTK